MERSIKPCSATLGAEAAEDVCDDMFGGQAAEQRVRRVLGTTSAIDSNAARRTRGSSARVLVGAPELLSLPCACMMMNCSLRTLRPVARSRWRAVPLRRPISVSAAELRFGQPLHETHPHLLQPGESTTQCLLLPRQEANWRCSHAWNHRTRILRPPREACQSPAQRLHRCARRLRCQVPLGCRLLQVPPGSRLPVFDRYSAPRRTLCYAVLQLNDGS